MNSEDDSYVEKCAIYNTSICWCATHYCCGLAQSLSVVNNCSSTHYSVRVTVHWCTTHCMRVQVAHKQGSNDTTNIHAPMSYFHPKLPTNADPPTVWSWRNAKMEAR